MNKKIAAIILVLGLALIAIFQSGFYKNTQKNINTVEVTNENPKLVSTSPSPLEEAVLLPAHTIELTFNKPLVNIPETKIVLEPTTEATIELSNDRKTVKITPLKPYLFGQGYTLIIKGETKFEGNQTLGGDIIYHFKTPTYQGV